MANRENVEGSGTDVALDVTFRVFPNVGQQSPFP
jgi:hypothetical protein